MVKCGIRGGRGYPKKDERRGGGLLQLGPTVDNSEFSTGARWPETSVDNPPGELPHPYNPNLVLHFNIYNHYRIVLVSFPVGLARVAYMGFPR
jgi:hypothetical protein